MSSPQPAITAAGDRFGSLSDSARARLRRAKVPESLSPMLATLTSRRFSAHRVGQGERFYEQACQRCWEGLIAKDARSPYRPGSRAREWLKLECELSQELVIGGFADPQGSRLGFGALLLGCCQADRLIYAGKVGTGFDRTTLRELHQRLVALETAQSPFATTGAARRDVPGSRSTGCDRSSSPRSASPNGPATAACGTRASRACARTGSRVRWSARGPPDEPA